MFVSLHKYLPQYFLTGLGGWLANCRIKFVKTILIKYFIWRFDISLEDIIESDINQYDCFNHFFIRQLKPELRPIASAENAIVSPVDGFIYHFGEVTDKQYMFTAKGFEFTLETLLADKNPYVNAVKGGDFICMYLSPKDYHRVHMPYTGTLIETTYVPGSLYSVDPKVFEIIPGIFAKNERLICLFETALGPMIIILIGATLVGSIHSVWAGCCNAEHQNTLITNDCRKHNITLNKGDEMGHFQMGSTVICMFPRGTVTWSEELTVHKHMNYGEVIGISDKQR